MVFFIELSYDLNKYGNKFQDTIFLLAERFGCQYLYCDYEFEGSSKRITRSHIVYMFKFDESIIAVEELEKFMENIKKLRKVYIESVCNENNELVMTSSYYRKKKQTR